VITCAEAGRVAAAGNTTLNLTDAGGGGTFTITLASGATGTITSGTSTITDSPKALAAGANTITASGTGTATLNLTLGTGGNWSSVNSWSAATGGVSGASVPTSSDNTIFNANSFTAASQILTVDAAASCLAMDWTGATNTPTFYFNGFSLTASGSCTFIDAMSITNSGNYAINFNAAGAITATFPSGSIALRVAQLGVGSLTFASALTTTLNTQHNLGTIDTGNFNVSCGSWSYAGTAGDARTVTLGTSTITTTASAGWSYSGATNTTITANTSTITVTGTGVFAGGTPASGAYNNINLNGTAHTISGTFTCATLALPAATDQTITLTAGIRVTCTTATLSGDASHTHIIQSGTAGSLASIWATNKTDSYVTYIDILRNYNGVIVSDCSGVTGGTFAGADGSFTSLTIQGSGNYPLTITGSNTFTTIYIDASSVAKTIKFTDGTTTTYSTLSRDAGTNYITLTGTGTAGWNIVKV
jgi:hypothetical protein